MMREIVADYSDEIEEFEDEKQEEDSGIRPYEVDCLPNDYNITTLMSLISRGYMKIPSFQRNYIWKIDMASYSENVLDISTFELADAGMACLTELSPPV